MKKLSQRLKDGRREIQDKMPRPNKPGPNGIPNGAAEIPTASPTRDNANGAAADEDLHDRGHTSESKDSAVDLEADDFDLAAPRNGARTGGALYLLERKSLLMFSKAHMRIIMQDFKLLRKFAAFLVASNRPEGVHVLAYHLDCRKALAAIKYSNTVAAGLSLAGKTALDGGVGETPPPATLNEELLSRAEESFQQLAGEYLPMWVTNVWVRAVEVSIRMRITGSLPSRLRE